MSTDTTLPLRRLGFLTIGTFDPADPATGIEDTLDIIEYGEKLGFDSAWLRNRHMQHGITSPMTVLAAASQRTSRIDLGTAVTPLGPENPLRLAEDMATVDLLTGGRLNPGVSVGTPFRYDGWKDALYPDTAEAEDFSKRRVDRLVQAVRGDEVASFETIENTEEFTNRVQPHAEGLVNRLWYGSGSRASTQWAAESGLNLLSSSVISAETSEDFDETSAPSSTSTAPTTATSSVARRVSPRAWWSSPPTPRRKTRSAATRPTSSTVRMSGWDGSRHSGRRR